jgi:hypothetical protein
MDLAVRSRAMHAAVGCAPARRVSTTRRSGARGKRFTGAGSHHVLKPLDHVGHFDIACVNHNGAARTHQRTIGARRIGAIALDDLRENLRHRCRNSLQRQLLHASTRPDVWSRVEIDTHVGIGEDNRTLVASLGDKPGMATRDVALCPHHFGANIGV